MLASEESAPCFQGRHSRAGWTTPLLPAETSGSITLLDDVAIGLYGEDDTGRSGHAYKWSHLRL